jgi:hypothetical protein
MNAVGSLRLCALVLVAALLTGCVTAPPAKQYANLAAESPRSILVVPTLNNTLSVTAPDFFLSTISKPFANRGYYVFPAHMVKQLLDEGGLSDAGLVHNADPKRLGKLFGCDAVLFVTIQQWDSKYMILATQTTVKFDYMLKSCKTGLELWSDTEAMAYSPQQSNSSGNAIADLISAAIAAAIEKGAPNYMPLATQANQLAASGVGRGIPPGPYLAVAVGGK